MSTESTSGSLHRKSFILRRKTTIIKSNRIIKIDNNYYINRFVYIETSTLILHVRCDVLKINNKQTKSTHGSEVKSETNSNKSPSMDQQFILHYNSNNYNLMSSYYILNIRLINVESLSQKLITGINIIYHFSI